MRKTAANPEIGDREDELAWAAMNATKLEALTSTLAANSSDLSKKERFSKWNQLFQHKNTMENARMEQHH